MRIKTTNLKMFARPERVVSPPREGLLVVHAKKPTVPYYRYLYDTVGRGYCWPRCKRPSDVELAALLNDPRLEVPVLTAEGVPAGTRSTTRTGRCRRREGAGGGAIPGRGGACRRGSGKGKRIA
jgi:hypothetical protein